MIASSEWKYDEAFYNYDNTSLFLPFIYREGQFISPCGGIFQGLGTLGSRIGNRITLTSFQMKYSVQPFLAGQGSLLTGIVEVFYLRCIIFTWRDDSIPTISDILSTNLPGSGEAQFSNILCPLWVEGKVKRKILYDKTSCHYKTYTENASGNVESCYNPAQVYNIYIPIRKFREVYYNGIESEEYEGVNKIYVLFISSATNPDYPDAYVGEAWPVYVYWRINYKDI